MPEAHPSPTPATGGEIRSILGPVDDEMIFVIRETGASKNEILHAFACLNDDEAGRRRPMEGRTRAVYEILQESQDSEPER